MSRAHTVPRVTVLMPTYNASAYLEESIRSILRQTFTDFEFLVIDDGSTDDTSAVMRTFDDPRIRYISHDDNVGLAPRLNEGLALARGEYIVRMDADDVSRKDRLALQVRALDDDPDLALISARSINIDERGNVLSGGVPGYNDHEILWYLCIDSPFLHSAVTFRRRIIHDKLGGYDPSIIWGEDYELWSRLARRGYRARQLPQTLVAVRRHVSSMSGRLREYKYATNLAVIQQNLQFVFPDVSSSERDHFAELVASHNFGRLAITRQFVREYLTFYRRFSSARGLSVLKMRRVLSVHFIRWGSLAKAHMRWQALWYVAEGVLLEPRNLALFELPVPLRRLMAREAGQFWTVRA